MKALLQFENYSVIETIYKLNPNFEEEEEHTVSPNIHYDLQVIGSTNENAEVDLVIDLGDESLENNSFYVKAKVRGYFTLEGEILKNPEKAINLYKENGIAILFPYVRSLISDLTGKGSETPIIFPTINVVEFLKKSEEEKEKTIDN